MKQPGLPSKKQANTSSKLTQAQIKAKVVILEKENNCKVTYETITDNGQQYVAFFKQPNILAGAKCMDMILAGKLYQAGFTLWEACFIREHSDAEMETNDSFKLGLCGKLGLLLDAKAPDIKKN